jgi:iron complex outermembrane receptor protein
MPAFSPRSAYAQSAFGLALLASGSASAIELTPVFVSVETPVVQAGAAGAGAAPQPGTLIVVDKAYAAVTVVPRSEIELEQYKTLGDALFNKPGLSGTTFAPGAANRPIIRGLDNFRVRIQENGASVGDVSALGEDHPVPVDPLASQQIEVIRGPATLRYGSQAIGGVVSATNNRIPTFIPANGFSATTLTGVSSVDFGIDHVSEFDAGAENFAIHADILARAGQNYTIPGGVQANSAANRQAVALGGSYIFDNGFAGVAFSSFNTTYHIPGGEEAEAGTRIHARQEKMMAKGEVRTSSGLFDAFRYWLSVSDYRHQEIGRAHAGEEHDHAEDEPEDQAEGGDDPLAQGLDSIHAVFKAREQELRAELQQAVFATPFGALNGAIGIQLGNRALATSGEAGSLLAPTQTRSLAAYLFEEVALTETTRVQAAGRIEYASVGGTAALFPADFLPPPDEPATNPTVRTFLPLNVSLGILQDLPWDMVVSLSGLYVQRAPSAPELYSMGPHDATGTFEIGDPNLSTETARSVEFGLRRANGPLRFDASAYYTAFRGFIYKRLTGTNCDEDFASCGTGAELQQIVYSQQNATFTGVEIAVQYDLMPIGPGLFGVESQYDYVRARFTDGANVPRIPPMRVGGGFYYRDDQWFARIGLIHAFAQNLIAPYETPTAGYDNLRTELAFRHKLSPGLGFEEIRFGIVGDNLLNDDMRNSASFKKNEILLPGRGFRAHVALRF